jgi:8-oxo-dGTP pyrophosphatase MutT (NUDIX family)
MIMEIDPNAPTIVPARFAVAIIVLRQNTDVEGGWECLLVARKDDHTRWSLPGGKVDPDEVSVMAAIRELKEETGIRLGPRFHEPELTNKHGRLSPTFRMIPQGTVLDSGGYFTTFYLLDTTGMELPETFTVAEHEAPVEWGPIHKLLEGPYGRENAERLQKLGVIK